MTNDTIVRRLWWHPARLAHLRDRPWLGVVSAACPSVPSPYTLLSNGAGLLERLVEGAALEVEFDRIGRELLWLNKWQPGYAEMWADALAAALEARRPKEEAIAAALEAGRTATAEALIAELLPEEVST